MRKLLLSAVAAISLIYVSGCSEQSEQTGASQGAAHAPNVSVMTVVRQNVKHTVTLPGRVSPIQQSQVRPQVEGVLIKRLFEEGALVEKGQQLYQIDDARYAAQLASAKADLKSAQANLKTLKARAVRYKDLLNRNAVSQQDYDDALAQAEQAEAQISVAQAAVDLAQVDLDFTRVYAPISGQIGRSFVTVGSLVTASQEQQLATITQLDPIYVDMQQSGKGMLTLRRAMQAQGSLPVSVMLDEASGDMYEYKGTLKFSEVTVDESTGAVTLRAEFPNPEAFLMPGMFVKATVLMSQTEELTVPQRATSRLPDGTITVMTVNAQDIAEVTPIKVSGTYQDLYTVSSGLTEGSRVIVTGYLKVQPGSKVSPTPWQAAGSQKP